MTQRQAYAGKQVPIMSESRAAGRRRLYAVALFLGGGVLLVRAITLFVQDAPSRWVRWVGASLYVESAAIVVALVSIARWFVNPNDRRTSTAFWATAVLVVVHAFRVTVFALGRTGPWVDFDVRPEFRADHGDTWTWGEVYFASAAALSSLIMTLVVWRQRRRAMRSAGRSTNLVDASSRNPTTRRTRPTPR